MGTHIHTFAPGASPTMAASADIIGGRLLEITGDKEVAHAAAKSAKSIGVAGTDVSDGDDVLVLRGGFQYLTCSAAVTAGARVEPTADGKVGPKTDTAGIGLAVTTTTGADQLVLVALD